MCRPTNLVANTAARLDLCTCGCLHLHLGPVMLRLSPELLPGLAEALRLAGERLPAARIWQERLGPGRSGLDN